MYKIRQTGYTNSANLLKYCHRSNFNQWTTL